jgi:hypothetical protein
MTGRDDRWAKLSRELAGAKVIHPAICTCGCPLHEHQGEQEVNPDLVCANHLICGCTGWRSSTSALREGRF